MMKKIIKNDYLSRVEGEGGIFIEIKDGKISRLNFKIFEAPRFFEAFLKGRSYFDVPDFTSRICGICPIAYIMTSIRTIEAIFDVKVDDSIQRLRRLLSATEWLNSHALHVYMLHGPDFYNIESFWENKDYLEIVKRGFVFKKLANQLTTIIGGRSIHPVSAKVGGFYTMPNEDDLMILLPELERAYEESLKGIKWACSLDFTDLIYEGEYFSLRHEGEYPMNEGYIISNRGVSSSMDEFFNQLYEYQVDHSTSLHVGIKRKNFVAPYLTGPLARLNLNYDRLPPDIIHTIKEAGISFPIKNIKMSIVARSIEIAYSIYEIIRIIKDYKRPERFSAPYAVRGGMAVWITEAPRGMLIHRYNIDDKGIVCDCNIIPPTTQNLFHIESTVRDFVQSYIDKPADYIRKECEKIIRSYDPCISCATHILIL
ncbi:MAG: nickel-dependent hydrogenase large subunit [Thermodesulfovibrionales bacterium]|nr:nickel-dependent hydrogenase large subunit [Thermodesulfovibrionales bacterium]